jgi:hypothetical protein
MPLISSFPFYPLVSYMEDRYNIIQNAVAISNGRD